MFLAINEMKHSKMRYALIVGVMFLIAYLVFFLTGLAYGLAQDNRTAVDKWQADYIVLTSDANDSISMSMLTKADAQQIKAKETAFLAQTPAVIMAQDHGLDEKINVSFFGIETQQFLMPKITQGREFETDDEAVADESLAKEYGLEIGDTIKISGNDKTFKLVGLTENAKFNVAPVIYITLSAYQQVRYETTDTSDSVRMNAVVVRGAVTELGDNLEKMKISTFINELPGYEAQVLTFGFMIGFLIVIAAIVIGIFIYVLTMQKTAIFGVLKAQGIPSAFIARSVIAQTFLLALIGVSLGLLGTVLTGLGLPAAVPFQSNWLFFAGIAASMLIVAVLGGLFSVRAIVKIDPLKAIG